MCKTSFRCICISFANIYTCPNPVAIYNISIKLTSLMKLFNHDQHTTKKEMRPRTNNPQKKRTITAQTENQHIHSFHMNINSFLINLCILFTVHC